MINFYVNRMNTLFLYTGDVDKTAKQRTIRDTPRDAAELATPAAANEDNEVTLGLGVRVSYPSERSELSRERVEFVFHRPKAEIFKSLPGTESGCDCARQHLACARSGSLQLQRTRQDGLLA
jgi:hypothetical protein